MELEQSKSSLYLETFNLERKRVRKYYLTLHVKEAHFLFLEEYSDNPIVYSKFSNLRPQNVLFLKNTPADQCKCFLHENFLMMLRGLGLQYNHQFWEGLLCSQITCKNLQSDCWQNNCEDCQNGACLTMETTKFTPESHVQWKLWEKLPEIKRLEIKHHESCAAELLNDIKTTLPQLQEHVRIKQIQASAFENDKKHGLVLQLDFAMNYGCEWQGEVQSALWSRSSVTLFTSALFDAQNTLCFLIVSDTNDKSKNTVAVFLTNLLNVIPANNRSKLIIWTDGPSSEFKNRYMAYLLHELNLKFQEKFHNISWKYTATSHGKGVVDGIGGSAKARVRAEVLARRETVQTALDFSRVAAEVMPNITVMSIMQHQIDEESEAIDWSKAQEVKGIQSIHGIIFENSELHFCTNCGCKETAFILKYLEVDNKRMSKVIITGSFLLVKVAGKKRWQNFVCQVSIPEDENHDLTVSYLKKVSATGFSYVENAEQYQVSRSDIVKVLQMPTISDRFVMFNEPVDAQFG